MDYVEARDYLYALKTSKSTYGLERMEAFSALLGHPHKRFPCIHVAGTNGKGSVCAMLESIYREAGYKTGLYTSPHLVYLGERVQVNRVPIATHALAHTIGKLRPIAESIAEDTPELQPSFFEFMTALAFEHFAQSGVDIAIIETGLGGRLDATNVLKPEISLITTVDYDHMDILGDTLEKIAFEKAGIIKQRTPVLMGNLAPSAEAVVRSIAKERDCPFYALKERNPNPEVYPETALHGRFQRENAALVRECVHLLQDRFPVTETQITTGLERVRWEGRWQTLDLKDGKRLILDATHNREGAQQLDENLAELVSEHGKPLILAGTTGEARARDLMPIVAKHARSIHLLRPKQERAVDFPILEAAIPQDFTRPISRHEVNALFPAPYTCSLGSPGDTIVATGSLYLIGEILACIRPNTPDDGASLQD